MAAIRTQEQIQELLAERKRIKLHQKELERQRYKKAAEEVKKELKKKKKLEKQKLSISTFNKHKSLNIYSKSCIIRETAETDLYHTREELIKDSTGEINWKKWNELVEKLIQQNSRCW